VPVPWSLDDLVFARVRAAAGATPIRRIAYAKGIFDSYYQPQGGLFRNRREELTNLIRQIAANAGCERYLVVMRSQGQFPGTNQPIAGIGIVNRSAGVFDYSFLFAHVGVIVFDSPTFEIRKDPNATSEGVLHRMADNLVQDENLRKIDNSAFPAAAADAAGNAVLRDNVRGLLAERLDKILPAYFRQ
jgi:hypothetical protein